MKEASAHGVFPTPVDRILSAAKLTVIEDEFLNESALRQIKTFATSQLATVRRALGKILGLFHAPDSLVLIDLSMPEIKKPFVKLHEAGHGTLPHQKNLFAIIHDSEKTLDLETRDLFEREANVFASETLFQGSGFTTEAAQCEFGSKAVIKLASRYGSSNYAAFRRYVQTNSQACCVIVLEPAVSLEPGPLFREIRRVVCSESFFKRYDPDLFGIAITSSHFLAHLVPKNKMTAPRKIRILDRNGSKRNCMAEAFNSGRNVFILLRDVGAASTVVSVSATSFNPFLSQD